MIESSISRIEDRNSTSLGIEAVLAGEARPHASMLTGVLHETRSGDEQSPLGITGQALCPRFLRRQHELVSWVRRMVGGLSHATCVISHVINLRSPRRPRW